MHGQYGETLNVERSFIVWAEFANEIFGHCPERLKLNFNANFSSIVNIKTIDIYL